MIVAILNPKGGVGKTTTAVNLAAATASLGRRVLLVDFDPQAGASLSLGVRPDALYPSIADALAETVPAERAVRTWPRVANLHFITAHPSLSRVDERLRQSRQPERRLAETIRPLSAVFELIILDAPPGDSLLTLSVAAAAQYLLVPVQPEYLAIEALAQFLTSYRETRLKRKGLAALLSIVLTMVDTRAKATRELVQILRAHNRRGVLRTEVPREPRVVEAPSHGLPLVLYAPRSRAALAYRRLARELLHRLSSEPAR